MVVHWLSFFLGCLLSGGSAAVLVDFQVAQPVPVPRDVKQCTVKVLQHDFAFTFGGGEVVQLDNISSHHLDATPPTGCGPVGSWSAITLNLTVTSNGTQFDRLGIFTFQNVEIWRTSTPEPTRGDGIIWTYVKDVTQYMPLFTRPGTFILQLDNLVQPGLDGIYSTVLYATYYASSPEHPPAKTADLIIPLSTLSNTTGNDASVPPGFSINVTLPRNAVQVYAEILPSGNGQEESWYFNVPDQLFPSIPPSITSPRGPFREVRLLIDGQVAGAVFPYAVIFTGGFVPPSWRPITAYGALELPTYTLDVTPFLPLLTDGNPHNFTIDVVSAEANHTINQNWYVSGLLQVVTDVSDKPTTGKIISHTVEPFARATIIGGVSDGDVDFTVKATRQIRVESQIISGSGKSTHVVWSQDLEFSNTQSYQGNATYQFLSQTASGTVKSTHNGVTTVFDNFSYPLAINFTFLSPDETNWTTTVDHSYDRVLLPNPLRFRSTIHERQQTDGFFQLQTGGNFGNGTNNNTFSYVDSAGNTYNRRVNAAFNNITLDDESGTLAPSHHSHPPSNGLLKSVGPFAGASLPGGRRTGP